MGHFGFFVFQELDKDRSIYEGVTKRDFIENFEVSDDIVLRFRNYVNERERTNITFVAYNDVIKLLIKATLARQLYDDNAFFEIINKRDIMIDEVILLSRENNQFNN